MKVSMALAIENKGGVRSIPGDVICVRPAGWQWGTEEVKRFLIVEIDLGDDITTIQDARKLEIPHFETGELWYPEEMPKIIGKRRYNIGMADLAVKAQASGISLDMGKVNDLKVAYQPLENITIPFADMIKDKYTDTKLTKDNLTAIKGQG